MCWHMYSAVQASVWIWPNGRSLRKTFGAYRDSFAFSRLSHFFSSFRSEQLLNGHCSSETGHWEAQKRLARVSAPPNSHTTQAHGIDTHTLKHTPCKAWFSYGAESEMWPFSRCFSFAEGTLVAFHPVEFNYNGKQSWKLMHYVVPDVATTARNNLLSAAKTTLVQF